MNGEAQTPKVRLRGLSKRFGDLLAVDGADLELRRGEIHALLGENGAGKSTLMSMLAGLYRPDGGAIEVDGRRCSFQSPRDAMAASVGMVHQHFMLVPTLTVWENVLLGAERLPPLLRPGQAAREVQRAADELGLRVDARALVSDLGVGEQQRVEILRVLMRGARVMILDEPTAVLSPGESEALFVTLRTLCDQGCALVLISHKLEEVRRLAHRVTVMRRGRVVGSFDAPRAVTAEDLAAAMVGREVSLELQREAPSLGDARLTLTRLQVRSDRGLDAVHDLSLEVRGGELVGLAGVAGNGQVELMEAIAGLRRVEGGEILLCGAAATRRSARQRIAMGLRYVPEDRTHTGTAPSLSVLENLALRRYRDQGRWLRLAPLEAYGRRQIERLQIATSGPDQAARLLSGGNLQKLVLARELEPGRARVILALHPTRGLDARATAQVRQLLLDARGDGAAILLWSEDLDEVLALSDRVAVIHAGRIVRVVDHGEADLATIGRWMTGGDPAQEARRAT